MHLRELQGLKRQFEKERGWDEFPASLVYVHLTEELGEIGRHILFDEGYKVRHLGHEVRRELGREFAQVFSLFLQLANRFRIDLETEFSREIKIMSNRFGKAKWRRYMTKYQSRKT